MPAAKKPTVAKKLSTGKRATSKDASTEDAVAQCEPVVSVGETLQPAVKSMPSGRPFRADWRNPKAYPPPGCEDMQRLAWEFLRRNKRYAEHVRQMLALPPGEFDNKITIKGNACLDGMVCTPPAKPGETVKQYRKRIKDEFDGKKTAVIERPKLTFLNRWMLDQPIPVETPYDADMVQFVPGVVKKYRNKDLTARRARLMLYPNELAMRFRLDLPAKPQIERAKELLEKAMKSYEASVRQLGDGKAGEVLASNAGTRKKNSIADAHLWLRAYDADQEPKLPFDDSDKKRKRAQKSGPVEIAKQFKGEGVRSHFERGVVESYQSSAKRMIDKLAYRKFVVVLEASSKKSSPYPAWPPRDMSTTQC